MAVDLQTLGRAVQRARFRQQRALDAGLAEVGTTLAQWEALRALDRAPGASAHELAIATLQTDQAFGKLAGRMEARGLVERRSGHGRRIDHRLTPGGVRALSAGHEVVDRILAGAFAPLTDRERATLLQLLQRIGDAPADDPPPGEG